MWCCACHCFIFNTFNPINTQVKSGWNLNHKGFVWLDSSPYCTSFTTVASDLLLCSIWTIVWFDFIAFQTLSFHVTRYKCALDVSALYLILCSKSGSNCSRLFRVNSPQWPLSAIKWAAFSSSASLRESFTYCTMCCFLLKGWTVRWSPSIKTVP